MNWYWWIFFFFKQKTAYEILAWLEFRRVLFRSHLCHFKSPDRNWKKHLSRFKSPDRNWKKHLSRFKSRDRNWKKHFWHFKRRNTCYDWWNIKKERINKTWTQLYFCKILSSLHWLGNGWNVNVQKHRLIKNLFNHSYK